MARAMPFFRSWRHPLGLDKKPIARSLAPHKRC
jgi:hypothetical protein